MNVHSPFKIFSVSYNIQLYYLLLIRSNPTGFPFGSARVSLVQ